MLTIPKREGPYPPIAKKCKMRKILKADVFPSFINREFIVNHLPGAFEKNWGLLCRTIQ
jgi:hypothetical protein